MAEGVQIREVGMRDGLQSIAGIMPTETKLAWLDAEYAAGVREIEVSSFVPPKLLPQLADAEAVGADGLGPDPEFARRRARSRPPGARDEFRAVGQRGPQSVECAAHDR